MAFRLRPFAAALELSLSDEKSRHCIFPNTRRPSFSGHRKERVVLQQFQRGVTQ